MGNKKIKTLNILYQELDKIYKEIYKFCKICKYEDCKGYVWLLPEETKKLVNKNLPIIEVNKKLNFIDSFSRKNDQIEVDKIKPPCIFRKQDGDCSIYKSRPLICRLYPLDFKILNNNFYIVLHTDCLYIKKIIKNQKLDKFIEKISSLFYNISEGLLKKIFHTYKLINSVSKYPKNYKHNDYIKILKVANLKQRKLKICQSAKRFLIQKK